MSDSLALGITHKQLVEIAAKWLSRQYFGTVVLPEYSRANGEIPDVIGFGKRDSYIIECKTSRSDFLADKHKDFRDDKSGMGNYRWYLSPSIITPDELPDGWGLLDYRGNRIHKLVEPRKFTTGVREAEYHILQSLARRADIRGLLPQLRQDTKSPFQSANNSQEKK